MNTEYDYKYDVRKDLFGSFLLALVKKEGLGASAPVLVKGACRLVDAALEQHAEYDRTFNEGK